MTIGRKTGGRDFKPGKEWTGNTKGAPHLPDDIRKMRRFSKQEFERTTNKFLQMAPDEIYKYIPKKGTSAPEGATVGDVLIASVIVRAIYGGDHRRLGFLLDRLIGKVPVRITGEDGGPVRIEHDIRIITDEEAERRVIDIGSNLNRYFLANPKPSKTEA